MDDWCHIAIDTTDGEGGLQEYKVGCNLEFNPLCELDEKGYTALVDPFEIAKFEVTNRQYKACVDASVCEEPKDLSSYSYDDYFGNPPFNDFPVLSVTWVNARTYCVWAGGVSEELTEVQTNPYQNKFFSGDLMTEAQFEVTARNGKEGWVLYPWGNDFPNMTLANYGTLFNSDVTYVGQFPAGASTDGIECLVGNANEWVRDIKGPNPEGLQVNYSGPSGEEGLRVRKGGSFGSNAPEITVYGKSGFNPENTHLNLGFRCVLNNVSSTD